MTQIEQIKVYMKDKEKVHVKEISADLMIEVEIMSCNHAFLTFYKDCEHCHCTKCEICQSINDCTHTKCYSKGKVIDMLTELSEEFNSASYLSHEQRYKASCRVDEVIKWFKNERQ